MEDKELYETEQCECGLGEECECLEENNVNLEDLVKQLNTIPPIELDNETMDEICSSEEFNKGIVNVLEVCGSLTALVNCGLTVEGAMDYILTMKTMEHNMELQKLNNQYGIDVARVQNVQIEKGQI